MNEASVMRRLSACQGVIDAAEDFLTRADKLMKDLNEKYAEVVAVHEKAVAELENIARELEKVPDSRITVRFPIAGADTRKKKS
jgi:hypothetical protein